MSLMVELKVTLRHTAGCTGDWAEPWQAVRENSFSAWLKQYWQSTSSMGIEPMPEMSLGGAGVPSDHLPTQTRKIVTRSSGSSAAITGEPGRSAPQLFAASPETKNIRCGCQLMPRSFKYCCFDSM